MNTDDRVFIVTALLPFSVVRGTGKKKFTLEICDENLIYSILYQMKETNICDVVWVGMLRNFHDFRDEEIYEVKTHIYLIYFIN